MSSNHEDSQSLDKYIGIYAHCKLDVDHHILYYKTIKAQETYVVITLIVLRMENEEQVNIT